MRGTSRISTPAIKATIGCKWAMLIVMAPPDRRPAYPNSANFCKALKQQKDDCGNRQCQQQDAPERGAGRRSGGFFAVDLPPPRILGALYDEPRLCERALVRLRLRGRAALRLHGAAA